MQSLLQVENLVKRYPARPTAGAQAEVRALDGVNFSLPPGAKMAIVGVSGSGKSTLAACLAGLERATSGAIRFEGRDIAFLAERELRAIRPRIQLVFQDPALALNPRFSVFDVVAEPWVIQGRLKFRERKDRASELLRKVGLPDSLLGRTINELSGGQRQRLAIARALAMEPRVLIFDESLSALDCSVQARIANLMLDLNAQQASGAIGPAIIFITHDMVMAAQIADVIAVMHRGRIVETAGKKELVQAPAHPATQALLACSPGFSSDAQRSPVH